MIQARTNDIILKQDLSNVQISLCGALPPPRWVFTQPTPLFIQKGLTDTVLQQELQIIHDKSANWYCYFCQEFTIYSIKQGCLPTINKINFSFSNNNYFKHNSSDNMYVYIQC